MNHAACVGPFAFHLYDRSIDKACTIGATLNEYKRPIGDACGPGPLRDRP